MHRFTEPSDVAVRAPRAPLASGGPGLAQRRAADVLPVGPAIEERGRRNWALALVATVARSSWLAVVLTVAFLAGGFGATLAGGRSLATAAPWIVMGSGVWLAVSIVLTVLRRR